MNGIERLRYIKNCNDDWKIIFKFYNYLEFRITELDDVDLHCEYWSFLGFCRSSMHKLKIPKVRNFCNKSNYKQVFTDLENQIKGMERVKELYWSENYKFFIDYDGKLQICIFDDYYNPDYPENYTYLLENGMK